MSQDLAQSLIANFSSEIQPAPAQFGDIVNYREEFIKSSLGGAGVLGLQTTGTKIYQAFRERAKGVLSRYGLTEQDLDELESSISSGDYNSAIAKIGSKLTSKITDSGRTALENLRSKLNEIKSIKPDEAKPLSNLSDDDVAANISKQSLQERYNALSESGKQSLNETLEDSLNRGLIQKGDMRGVSEIMEGVELSEQSGLNNTAQILGQGGDDARIGQIVEAPSAADDAATTLATAAKNTDVAASAISKANEASDILKDVSAAGESLDLDPVTVGLGLVLSLGSALAGLELKAHHEKFITPPSILRNYQVGTDV